MRREQATGRLCVAVAVGLALAAAVLELIDPASSQDLVRAAAGSISFSICAQRSVLLRVAATEAGTFHVAIGTP